MFSSSLLVYIQGIFIVVSAIWFASRKDELPLILSTFLFYIFSFRYLALVNGTANVVDITSFGLGSITSDAIESGLRFAVLGQTVLLSVYMCAQTVSLAAVKPSLTAAQGVWLRGVIFRISLICVPLVFLARGALDRQVGAGLSMGFQISGYLFLFPFVLISIAILIAALWKANQFRTLAHKVIAAVALLAILWLTFGSSGRFLFMGWMLAATFIFTSGLPIARRSVVLTAGVVSTIILFAIAGAMRDPDTADDVNLRKGAWQRFVTAEDANMLDGFALLLEVYPARLNYSYGMEHLEVLLRPIPRALWPGKPVGGYMNKLGLIDASSGLTLGISPSLFGSLYQEGGWLGLILLAGVYGLVFARLIVFSTRIHPFAGTLIRAILCAFSIPLFRGGDLPGIYAWFGMAFWPCLLILWLRRRDWFRRQLPPDRRRRMMTKASLSANAAIKITVTPSSIP